MIRKLFPLLFTVLIDSLGFGLVYPLFAELIANNSAGLFAAETSSAFRGWIFGLMVSSFFLAGFFSGPFLGALSDRKGRKKVLLLTIVLGICSYLLGVLALITTNLPLLLLGRVLAGISAGNFTVAQSMIGDLSKDEEKAKNFSLVGMAWGLGFIIGPYVGGRLASPFFLDWCGWVAPFAFAAFLCALNAILVLVFVPETLVDERKTPFEIWSSLLNMRKAFQNSALRSILIVMAVFSVGWGFFTEFISLFLIHRFAFDATQIGNFFAWVGIWVALCQGVLIRPFLNRFSSQRLLLASLFAGCCILPLLLLTKHSLHLFAVIPLVGFFEAFISPTSSAIVSNLATKESQGEILGINNSIQCLAYAVPPLFSGSLVALYPHLPVTVGSIAMLLAFTIFMIDQRKVKEA